MRQLKGNRPSLVSGDAFSNDRVPGTVRAVLQRKRQSAQPNATGPPKPVIPQGELANKLLQKIYANDLQNIKKASKIAATI